MNSLRDSYKPEEVKVSTKKNGDVEEINVQLGTDTGKPGRFVPAKTEVI